MCLPSLLQAHLSPGSTVRVVELRLFIALRLGAQRELEKSSLSPQRAGGRCLKRMLQEKQLCLEMVLYKHFSLEDVLTA